MKSILKVDETFIKNFLSAAKYRLAYIAPGISKEIAAIISEKWAILDSAEVRVILDVNSEIYRLGYGSADGSAYAMKFLDGKAKELGGGRLVCHQEGIRIGILISDARACFFAPTALLIESGTDLKTRPNGIIIEPVPSNVIKEIGLGEKKEIEQTIGLDKVNSAKIDGVIEDIKQNPPQKFDVARRVRVFNSRFQFVELKVEGCSLSKHKVAIPPELMGLADDEELKKRLRSSFQLITNTIEFDKGSKVSEKTITDLRKNIEEEFLGNIPGYGKVILRENKDAFNKKVEELTKVINDFKNAIKSKLDEAIKNNISTLTERLLPSVEQHVPARWKKDMGQNPKKSDLKKRLEAEISNAFGKSEIYVNDMKAEAVFKNVSYESLQDAKFMASAKKAFPYVDLFHEEYDALKGSTL